MRFVVTAAVCGNEVSTHFNVTNANVDQTCLLRDNLIVILELVCVFLTGEYRFRVEWPATGNHHEPSVIYF